VHLLHIGPYRILRVLGQGGMGLVYEAEQLEPFHRMVALKVIRLGMDHSEVLARFESERQSLAVMDHPNIAKALDAGTTRTGFRTSSWSSSRASRSPTTATATTSKFSTASSSS
jgi:serine/threonine protein kinase